MWNFPIQNISHFPLMVYNFDDQQINLQKHFDLPFTKHIRPSKSLHTWYMWPSHSNPFAPLCLTKAWEHYLCKLPFKQCSKISLLCPNYAPCIHLLSCCYLSLKINLEFLMPPASLHNYLTVVLEQYYNIILSQYNRPMKTSIYWFCVNKILTKC